MSISTFVYGVANGFSTTCNDFVDMTSGKIDVIAALYNSNMNMSSTAQDPRAATMNPGMSMPTIIDTRYYNYMNMLRLSDSPLYKNWVDASNSVASTESAVVKDQTCTSFMASHY